MVPSPGLVLRCVGVIWVSIGVFTAGGGAETVATLPGGGKIKQNRPKSTQIVQNRAPYPTKREQSEPFFEAVNFRTLDSRVWEPQETTMTEVSGGDRAPYLKGAIGAFQSCYRALSLCLSLF